jgi:hypothetical protein
MVAIAPFMYERYSSELARSSRPKPNRLQCRVPLRTHSLRPARYLASITISCNYGLVWRVGRVVLLNLRRTIQFRIGRVLPLELLHNISLQTLHFGSACKSSYGTALKSCENAWRIGATRKNIDVDLAKFNDVSRRAKSHDEEKLCDLVSALEYYERTGVSPEGFDISG